MAKALVRGVLPLTLRKGLARRIGRSAWLPDRYYWSMELIRDFAERDPEAFHRFLWSHHLAYAETYEPDQRFGRENLHPSRRLLFDDLEKILVERGVDKDRVRSVLEVGCSLGYLLRHIETCVLPSARILEGVDIDGPAVEAGSRHLSAHGSRVRLHRADMTEIDACLGDRRYDLVLCLGTLMYLEEEAASDVVASMLERTDGLLVLAGLADPERDNAELPRSGVRARDHSFVHNLDAMVAAGGGRVVARRWEGDRIVGGNSIYFVFAAPADARAAAAHPCERPEPA